MYQHLVEGERQSTRAIEAALGTDPNKTRSWSSEESTGSASEDLNGLDPEYYEADCSFGSDTDPFAGVVVPAGGVHGPATGTN